MSTRTGAGTSHINSNGTSASTDTDNICKSSSTNISTFPIFVLELLQITCPAHSTTAILLPWPSLPLPSTPCTRTNMLTLSLSLFLSLSFSHPLHCLRVGCPPGVCYVAGAHCCIYLREHILLVLASDKTTTRFRAGGQDCFTHVSAVLARTFFVLFKYLRKNWTLRRVYGHSRLSAPLRYFAKELVWSTYERVQQTLQPSDQQGHDQYAVSRWLLQRGNSGSYWACPTASINQE